MKTKLMVFFVIVFLIFGNAFGEDLTKEKKAAIKKLIQLSNGKNLGKMFVNSMLQNLAMVWQQNNKNVPPEVFEIARNELIAIFDEEMEKETYYEMLYPIYHKYLSLEEINQIIEFYQTPVGKKLLKVLPDIFRESMLAGQKWGESLAPVIKQRVMQRLKEAGYDL